MKPLVKIIALLAAASITAVTTNYTKGELAVYDLFVGTVVDDGIVALSEGESLDAEKINVTINHRLGGGVLNAAAEFQRSGDREEPMVFAIIGPDALGQELMNQVKAQFPRSHQVVAAERTRASIIVPTRKAGKTKTLTVRSKLDHKAVYNATVPHLANCRRLFIASMTARDFPLVASLLDLHSGESYMIPTAGQLADRKRTMDLLRRLTYVQVNRKELGILTGVKSGFPDRAFEVLARHDINSVIVTDGANGFHALHNGWKYQGPGFVVDVVASESSAGDTFGGAVLAGLGHELEFTEILENAASAAAMAISAVRREGGYDELSHFANSTAILIPKHFAARSFVAAASAVAVTASVTVALLFGT